ncbi:starvation-inducible DNA-binding protein [Deinococcus yavapaiensis KR-236]|uniref:Starvation-inducible DNA-binding protein n=2 Tax=Deinococcus TaxID=1298 RepID=A0A318S7B6_9DEIO|nr:starvation-inducible DNA-binding protein [Deinococcus yavapaiensis KR-236]
MRRDAPNAYGEGMTKRNAGTAEPKPSRKRKAAGTEAPVMDESGTMTASAVSNDVNDTAEMRSGEGTHTDAAHDRGDAHAKLIDHSYLAEEEFGTIAETLQRNLATTISLYLKFKKFHWDIRGRTFHTLHETYDEMAAEIFPTIDVIAERLVMLGGSPVAAPAEVDRYSPIRVPTDTIHDARAQLQQLVDDHTLVTRSLRDDSKKADDADDPVTADLYNATLLIHDKHRWMLAALLDDDKMD